MEQRKKNEQILWARAVNPTNERAVAIAGFNKRETEKALAKLRGKK